MLERIMGILTLKAPTYKAVAEDKSLTQEAMMIVIAVSVINGIVSAIVSTTSGAGIVVGAIGAVISIVVALINWYVASWVLAFVAKQFGGKTETDEMLRVTGYVNVFGLVSALSILGVISTSLLCVTGIVGIVVWVLSVIGYVIGVREAAEFSTQNAVITAVVALVATIIVSSIAGAISTAVMIMFA